MKKFQLVGAALVAVFVLGALTAGSASALTFLLAEWLEGGGGLTTTKLGDIEGELLLAETLTILGVKVKIDALCSGIFDGEFGPNGADEITELLTLEPSSLVSGTALVEPGLACTNTENCPEPLAWATELPWLTLLVLMEDSGESFFADLLTKPGGKVGYYVICMGSSASDSCTTTEAAAKVTNTGEGLDSEFSEAFTELAELKLANCEVAGVEQGIVEGLGFALIIGGGALTASSEG